MSKRRTTQHDSTLPSTLVVRCQVTFTPKVDAAATETRAVCTAQTRQGHVTMHPASVNRHLEASGWVVYHEKVRICLQSEHHHLPVLVC